MKCGKLEGECRAAEMGVRWVATESIPPGRMRVGGNAGEGASRERKRAGWAFENGISDPSALSADGCNAFRSDGGEMSVQP